jgi:hypothetical protein
LHKWIKRKETRFKQRGVADTVKFNFRTVNIFITIRMPDLSNKNGNLFDFVKLKKLFVSGPRGMSYTREKGFKKTPPRSLFSSNTVIKLDPF